MVNEMDNEQEDLYRKYLRSELGRAYLIAKIEDLEKEIKDLQKRLHEAAHKVEMSHRSSEYWQNMVARNS